MILIIAEKPSLARNIVAGIGKMNKRDGYYEDNSYIVSWAFGHLFSLYDIESYFSNNENVKAKWSMDILPFFPNKFEFELKRNADHIVDSGAKKQFEIIKSLCNRNDVDTIVNAGDADREGEIIIRLCIEKSGVNGKKFLRLWLPDQTPETVSASLGEMKDSSCYDNLSNEGYARTYIDWLYGVNLTRYATLKTGKLLRVGRVIVPIVRAIYDRDMQIENFVPDKYYAISSNEQTAGEKIELQSKFKFTNKEQKKAIEKCNELNSKVARVTDKKVKKDVILPGKLYSLSKLQNVLGKKNKMSMEDSLRIVQSLYEKGFLTYPRTNSEYLATTEKDKIKKILFEVKKIGYNVEFKDKKTIFDDSKIESHSAITPTYKIPNKTDLSQEELIVYSTVMKRFVAVFCAEECKCDKTEIQIDVGDIESFTLKGIVITQKGWTKYDEYSQKDKVLPNLEVGDVVNIKFQPVEKETSAPKHYTIETLNNYLKNPFKEDKQNIDSSDELDDKEYYKAMFAGVELGTEATRTAIIGNAIKTGYIELKKDVYKLLPAGKYLVESLNNMNIAMDKYKTSDMGQNLKKVYHNELLVEDCVQIAKNEIISMFNVENNVPIEEDRNMGFFGDVIGKCPVCGREVKRFSYGYNCTGYKEGCKFQVNGIIAKRNISKSNVELLLTNRKTSKIKGFISKNGKEFDAFLILDSDNTVKFTFE